MVIELHRGGSSILLPSRPESPTSCSSLRSNRPYCLFLAPLADDCLLFPGSLNQSSGFIKDTFCGAWLPTRVCKWSGWRRSSRPPSLLHLSTRSSTRHTNTLTNTSKHQQTNKHQQTQASTKTLTNTNIHTQIQMKTPPPVSLLSTKHQDKSKHTTKHQHTGEHDQA